MWKFISKPLLILGTIKKLKLDTVHGSEFKEIGILKVFGTSLTSIVALLTQEYIKLELLAIVIAYPFA